MYFVVMSNLLARARQELSDYLSTARGKFFGICIAIFLGLGIFSIASQIRDGDINVSFWDVFTLIIVIPILVGIVYAFRNRSNLSVSKWIRYLGWIIFIAWILSFSIKGLR